MKSLFIPLIHLSMVALFIYPSWSQAQDCKRPNIILIICDDMRYDAFDITGAPDFLSTPSVDRIANEGARFDNFYCVYSLCVPSRASIMTGLYPHSHGAVDNCNTIKAGIPTLAEVLDSTGYHTAMIGKYHIEDQWQPGWDYWLATKGSLDYTNPKFYYFNNEKTINGNIEQIIYDTVHNYLSTIDTPFFITVGHLAPHRVCVPLPQYDGVFQNEQMPIPANFVSFKKWYPSFLYYDSTRLYLDTSKLVSDYEGYFEGILGIEDNTTDIFSILTQRNLLDNTMIILLSDNGAIFGEHILKGKGEAYEPSEHLPLFIRYPEWYVANTVYKKDFFSLTIDIMPSILDACCIDAAKYNMQGTSLRKLVSGEFKRPTFLYETVKLEVGSCPLVQEVEKPSIRSVRSKTYKYISYRCDQITEEFFDLSHDPLETTNQIHNPEYVNTIQLMRDNLENLRIQYFDTLSSDTALRDCWLVKAPATSISHTNIENPFPLRINPNPGDQNITLSTMLPGDGATTMVITNTLGEVLYRNESNPVDGMFSKQIDISHFPAGIYFVALRQEDKMEVITMMKN